MKRVLLVCILLLGGISFSVAQVSFSASNTQGCAPLAVSFTNNTVGATTYQWDFGDGNTSNLANPTHTYTQGGYFYVYLNAYDSQGGYLGSAYESIEVIGNYPSNSIYFYNQAPCPGDEVDMTVPYANGATYTWNFGDGSPTETNTWGSSSHEYTTPGTFTVTVSVNHPTCGVSQITNSITVSNNNVLTSAVFQIYPEEACPGDRVDFYTDWNYPYLFQFGDGTSTSTEYSHTYSSPGVYPVSVTLVNGCGSSVTAYDTVTISNNLPFSGQVSAWGDNFVCPGDEVDLSVDNGYQNPVWTLPNGVQLFGFNVSYDYLGGPYDTVYVQVENGCGFTSDTYVVIQSNSNIPVDDVDLFVQDSVCVGAEFPFYGNFDDGPGPESLDFTWNFGDGNTNSTNWGGYHSYATAGTYTVTLTAQNGCGNDTTATHQVFVGTNVMPSLMKQVFAVPEEACPGDSVLFVVFPYEPGTYSWNFGDGNTGSGIEELLIFGRTYGVKKHAYTSTGIFDVVLTYTNACGNSRSYSTQANIGSNVTNNEVGMTYLGDETLCLGEAVEFIAYGGNSFLWNFGDGSGNFNTTANFTPITHTFNNPGNYQVTVAVTNGCGNTQIEDLWITVPDNRINIVTNSVDSDCGQANGSAIAVVSGGKAPYVYQWSNGDQDLLAQGLGAGIYVVNVWDQNNCYNFAIATVSDDQAPTIAVNSVIDVSCFGDDDGAIDINVIGSSAPYTYQWSNGRTTEDMNNLEAGPYEITVTDANGCVANKSILVEQPEEVQMSFTKQNATCGTANGGAMINVVGNSGPYLYIWDNGHAGSTQNGLAAGIYTANVIDQNGCLISGSVAISDNGGPIFTITSISPLDCSGSGASVTGSTFLGTAPYTYLWSNGATTEDVSGLSEGEYSVVVTDQNGCEAYEFLTIENTAPDAIDICMVTVDSVYNVNQVVWEKPLSTDISHFNIYRESSLSGLYFNIGQVPYDSLSLFTDYVANPAVRSWRYKISAVDFCGSESQLSSEHKTIHLNQNVGLGNTVNLIWDHYEGFSFSTYDIIRYSVSTGWQVLSTISSNNTSYTDLTPPSDPTLFYVIQATPASPCVATRAANNNSTRSNRSQNTIAPPLSVEEVSLIAGATVFPNPNDGEFTLIVDLDASSDVNMTITNLQGQLIWSQQLNAHFGRYQQNLNLGDLPTGLYFLNVQAGSDYKAQRIVIR